MHNVFFIVAIHRVLNGTNRIIHFDYQHILHSGSLTDKL